MPFVPRGHVPLALVVKGLIEQLTHRPCDAIKQYKNGFQTMDRHRRTAQRAPSSRIPWGFPIDQGKAATDSNSQMDRLETASAHREQIRTIQQQVLNAVQQELGEGDVIAVAVLASGDLTTIPAPAWRTKNGEQAILGGAIRWLDAGLGVLVEGDPFVTDTTAEGWIDRLRQKLEMDAKQGSTPVAVPSAQGHGAARVEPKKTVNVRADISPERANRWMHAAATAAKTEGQPFARDPAVILCQKSLNCTRDVARSAYTGLPKKLKQARGKPAK